MIYLIIALSLTSIIGFYCAYWEHRRAGFWYDLFQTEHEKRISLQNAEWNDVTLSVSETEK